MSEYQFAKLVIAGRILTSRTMYMLQVVEWQSKREHIKLQLSDLPHLSQMWRETERSIDPNNPGVIVYDRIPGLRLANACEATANGLYSLSDIAASFANKVTHGDVPSSFNKIRDKAEKFPDWEMASTLGDLQWYKKVREIRTELTHHSSLIIHPSSFVGDPTIGIRSFRRPGDRKEFKEYYTSVALREFISWVKNAVETTDLMAEYLAEKYVIPAFDMNDKIAIPKFGSNGLPIVLDNGSVDAEEVTVGEYLRNRNVIK